MRLPSFTRQMLSLFAILAIVVVSAESAFAQTGQTGGGTTGGGTTGTTGGGTTGGGATGGIGLTTATPIDRAATTTNQAQSTGFVGGSSTENFVGGTRAATQTQGQNRQFQAFQSNQTTQNNQIQSGTARQVRTTLRMAFSYPAATAAQQNGQLSGANSLSLTRFVSTRPELSGINVSLTNSGEAILTGASPTTEGSRLAANLIRLQPGVRKVNNQVSVE